MTTTTTTFRETEQLIYQSQITEFPQPAGDTEVCVSYGRRLFPDLIDNLQSPYIIVRERTLKYIVDYLHKPENIAPAVQAKIFSALRDCLTECKDYPNLRQLIAQAYSVLAEHSLGRQYINTKKKVLPLLIEGLNDCSSEVRHYYFIALMHITIWGSASYAIEQGLIPILISRIPKTSDNTKEYLLACLQQLVFLEEGAIIAIDNDVVTSLLPLLKHNSLVRARTFAVQSLLAVTKLQKGKLAVCECNPLISQLVSMLSENEPETLEHTLGTLMNVCIEKAGKVALTEAQAPQSLVELIQRLFENPKKNETGLRLYAVQLLSGLGEHVPARSVLQQLLPVLEREKDCGDDIMKRVMASAIYVLTWKA